MKKRYLFIIAAGLAFVALGWAWSYFNGDGFKQRLSELVASETGRQMQMAGTPDLSIWGGPAVSLQDITLPPPDAQADAGSLKVDEVRVRLGWMDLLRGRLEASSVELIGPEVNYQPGNPESPAFVDIRRHIKNIRPDWILPEDDVAAVSALGWMLHQGVEVSDGRINWWKGKQGFELTELDLDSDITSEEKGRQVSLAGTLRATRMEEPLRFKARASLLAQLEQKRLSLADLTFNGRHLLGKLDVKISQIRVDAGNALPSAILNDLAVELDTPGPTLLIRAPRVDASGTNRGIVAESIELSSEGIDANGSLRAELKQGKPVLETTFATSRLDIPELAKSLLLPTDRLKAEGLQDATLTLSVRVDENAASIHGLEFNSQAIDLDAGAKRNHASGVIQAQVHAKKLDFDRVTANLKPGEQLALPFALPVALMQSINGKLDIRAEQLISAGLSYRDYRAEASADAKALRLMRLTAAVLGGEVKTSASIGRQKPFTNQAVFHAGSVRGGELLAALEIEGLNDAVTTIDASLRAQGKSEAELRNSVNGRARVVSSEGLIEGLDLAALIESLRGQQSVQAQQSQQAQQPQQGESAGTRFSSARGNFEFRNGGILNRDFVMQGDNFTITGSGGAHLVSEAVEYNLDVAIKDESYSLPLKITGRLAEPSLQLDVESFIRGGAFKFMESFFGAMPMTPAPSGE